MSAPRITCGSAGHYTDSGVYAQCLGEAALGVRNRERLLVLQTGAGALVARERGAAQRRRHCGGRLGVSQIAAADEGHVAAGGQHGATGVMTQWQKFVQHQQQWLSNAPPKLVCIDLQPYGTSQAPERDDILNIGGFSDAVFDVVSAFLSGNAGRFVAEVEAIEL